MTSCCVKFWIIPSLAFFTVLLVLSVLNPVSAGVLHVAAVSWNGSVADVIDGDTLEILHKGQVEQIRLHGIDCPEKRQPFGTTTKLATSALAFGQIIAVQPRHTEKEKRVVTDVLLPDRTNLSYELVKRGWCWWSRQYAPTDTELEAYERGAREGLLYFISGSGTGSGQWALM